MIPETYPLKHMAMTVTNVSTLHMVNGHCYVKDSKRPIDLISHPEGAG
jgi:hypothetical protein